MPAPQYFFIYVLACKTISILQLSKEEGGEGARSLYMLICMITELHFPICRFNFLRNLNDLKNYISVVLKTNFSQITIGSLEDASISLTPIRYEFRIRNGSNKFCFNCIEFYMRFCRNPLFRDSKMLREHFFFHLIFTSTNPADHLLGKGS